MAFPTFFLSIRHFAWVRQLPFFLARLSQSLAGFPQGCAVRRRHFFDVAPEIIIFFTGWKVGTSGQKKLDLTHGMKEWTQGAECLGPDDTGVVGEPVPPAYMVS